MMDGLKSDARTEAAQPALFLMASKGSLQSSLRKMTLFLSCYMIFPVSLQSHPLVLHKPVPLYTRCKHDLQLFCKF